MDPVEKSIYFCPAPTLFHDLFPQARRRYDHPSCTCCVVEIIERLFLKCQVMVIDWHILLISLALNVEFSSCFYLTTDTCFPHCDSLQSLFPFHAIQYVCSFVSIILTFRQYKNRSLTQLML